MSGGCSAPDQYTWIPWAKSKSTFETLRLSTPGSAHPPRRAQSEPSSAYAHKDISICGASPSAAIAIPFADNMMRTSAGA